MKATEIIRGVLDLIDQIDCSPAADQISTPTAEVGRFAQIFAMLSQPPSVDVTYDNSPDTVVSDVRSVTTDAGGGWNGPKQPSDLRADSISMYPNFQAKQ